MLYQIMVIKQQILFFVSDFFVLSVILSELNSFIKLKIKPYNDKMCHYIPFYYQNDYRAAMNLKIALELMY